MNIYPDGDEVVEIRSSGANNPISFLEKEDQFSIYPNPSNGVCFLKFNKQSTVSGRIEIYGTNGSRVYGDNFATLNGNVKIEW